MKIKHASGFVSIFLALIIIPTYLVSIISVDLYKIYLFKNYLSVASELAINEQLFNYNKSLKEKFNLLAITDDKKQVSELTKRSIENNLLADKSENFSTSIDKVETILDSKFALNRSEILEKQIIDAMRFEGPLEVSKGFINLLSNVKASKEYNKALAKKIEYNQALEDVSINRRSISNPLIKYSKLVEDINPRLLNIKDGIINLISNKVKVDQQIKGLEYKETKLSETVLMDIDKYFKSIVDEALAKDILYLFEFSKELNKNPSNQNIINFKVKFEKLKQRIDLIVQLRQIQEINMTFIKDNDKYDLVDLVLYINDTRDKIIGLYNKSFVDEKNELISNLEKIKIDTEQIAEITKNINDIFNKIKKDFSSVDQAKKNWDEAIELVSDQGLKNQMKSEYIFSNKDISIENIEAIQKKLSANNDKISNLEKLIGSSESYLNRIKSDNKQIATLDIKILENIKIMSGIDRFVVYKVLTKEKEKSKTDLGFIEALKLSNKLKSFNKSNNKQIEEERYLEKYISEKDINRVLSYLEDVKVDQLNKYSKTEVANSRDLKNHLDSNSNTLTINSNAVMNNLLLTSYIDKYLNSKISVNDGFVSQKEYVLFGAKSLKANNTIVNASIFSLRMGLNSIYAYSSPQLRKEALLVASALAGFTGFGVPIVENILIGMISFGESLLDINKLNNGDRVEGFKNTYSWQMSLLGIKNKTLEEIKKMTIKSIDNIFETIDDLSDEGVNNAKEQVDIFANQSIDNIVQSINSIFIIPIQNAIIQAVSEPSKNIKQILQDKLNQIEISIEDDKNLVTKKVKQATLSYLYDNHFNNIINYLENTDEIIADEITDLVETIRVDLEKYISDQTSIYSEKLKKEISVILDQKKEGYKETVAKKIDEFIAKFSNNEDKKQSMFASGAITFDYEDYLKLLIFIGLNTNKKVDILNRLGLVIDYEMRKVMPEFDISKAYTKIKVSIEANLVTNFYSVISGKREKYLKSEMEVGF